MRFPLPPVALDVVLGVALTGLAVATLMSRSPGGGGWFAVVLGVLQVAPIAVRQLAPLLAMALILTALAVYSLVGYGSWPNGGLGLIIAMFTVATLRTRALAAAAFAASIVVAAIGYLTTSSGITMSEFIEASLVMLSAWILGDGTRRWAQHTQDLAAQAGQAIVDERVRIARELHDILAHHLSVISVQAGLATYVLDADPPTAKSAIATVGDASRQALLDMRRLLDVLRIDDPSGEDAGYSPQPGLAQLDDLVARVRTAGLPVTLVVAGPVTVLAPGPDLCAYRVVQESLTNVLRHAGRATAQVAVEYEEHTLSVSITDDGTRRSRRSADSGHGIRGMRERAQLYGGVLSAQSAEERGFAVLLRLPLEEQK